MLIYDYPLLGPTRHPERSEGSPQTTICSPPAESSSCPLPRRGVGGWATIYSLLLGGFDGLHLGHRALLSEAKNSGSPILLTTMFGGKGKSLFTREERREIFAGAGVDVLFEIDLDETLRTTPAEDFAQAVFASFNVGAVYCGEDFRFGRDALGTPELLKQLAPCPVYVLPIVKERGEKISVSACKSLLNEREFSRLNAMLGGYFIRGAVEHGRQVGRTYGFPTLNLSVPEEKLLPPDGVYGGICKTPKGDFPTIVNIGSRPTFGVEERKIEAYLDSFSGDLYGATVEIYPTEFYRPISKFSSADALKAQLEHDIARLRTRRSF